LKIIQMGYLRNQSLHNFSIALCLKSIYNVCMDITRE
jgi:hypothetical protein